MRGRWPKIPQDKAFNNFMFLVLFELVFAWVPKNNQNIMCFYIFIKTCYFAHRRFQRHRDRKTRLKRESDAHLFTFEFKIASGSRHHRRLKILATLARKLDFVIFPCECKKLLRRVRLIKHMLFVDF